MVVYGQGIWGAGQGRAPRGRGWSGSVWPIGYGGGRLGIGVGMGMVGSVGSVGSVCDGWVCQCRVGSGRQGRIG